MSAPEVFRVLLVEDDPTDVLLIEEAFSESRTSFEVTHVVRLGDALEALRAAPFHVVLLDLGLPDSSGVETFVRLHDQAPEVPILVLTGLNDDEVGVRALREGAQDFLIKKHVPGELVSRSLRYAVERADFARRLRESEHAKQQAREFGSMERLSRSPDAAVTAQIYGVRPLREAHPEEFDRCVARYATILERALEQRVFKMENTCSDAIRNLSDHLGFLRSSARDVVEIYTTALRMQVENAPMEKANTYLEEGRITALELMGYLANYYRNFYVGPDRAKRESS